MVEAEGDTSLKTKDSQKAVDESGYDGAVLLAVWNGCVTNIETKVVNVCEVVDSYRDQWYVKQSFRISKTELRTRPICRHPWARVEGHLTFVITVSALTQFMQETTGLPLKKIAATLQSLREFVGQIGGREFVFSSGVKPATAQLVNNADDCRTDRRSRANQRRSDRV